MCQKSANHFLTKSNQMRGHEMYDQKGLSEILMSSAEWLFSVLNDCIYFLYVPNFSKTVIFVCYEFSTSERLAILRGLFQLFLSCLWIEWLFKIHIPLSVKCQLKVTNVPAWYFNFKLKQQFQNITDPPSIQFSDQ